MVPNDPKVVDWKPVINEYFNVFKEIKAKLENIAKRYMESTEGSGYYYIKNIEIRSNNEFSFLAEPSPSGVGGYHTLPLSLFDEQDEDKLNNQLRELREEELKKEAEHREKHTCQTCGHFDFNGFHRMGHLSSYGITIQGS